MHSYYVNILLLRAKQWWSISLLIWFRAPIVTACLLSYCTAELLWRKHVEYIQFVSKISLRNIIFMIVCVYLYNPRNQFLIYINFDVFTVTEYIILIVRFVLFVVQKISRKILESLWFSVTSWSFNIHDM